MSYSRSSSPKPQGGWSTSGHSSVYWNDNSRNRSSDNFHPISGNITSRWDTTKVRSEGVGRYPQYSTTNHGFLSRLYRNLSYRLSRFNIRSSKTYTKEKLRRGQWSTYSAGRWARLKYFARSLNRKTKLQFLAFLGVIAMIILFYATPLHYWWRRAKVLGGGKKFVVMLAANQGGGVMEWKGPREWAIERDSVKNKKKYVSRWGYELEIVDMSTKKRYAHEWREGWERVDTIRNSMRKYPDAEWFWWLDLNTFIMEPSYSLQSHVFNHLADITYRDINDYNPLNITHPFPANYLGEDYSNPNGDGKISSINLIVPQDCSGFNLGSFFVRRSSWTDRLLDIWWDPVCYEQKHMEWEHKEQDALEYLYANQPWIRPHTAFIPQRRINSFPEGACSEKGNDTNVHYKQKDRDFVVNMAGCEWGRDCWGEMYTFRELSNKLNRTLWERFKEDFVAAVWKKLTGQKVRL
ncbi:putative alpha-1,6-mannosyltransferase [Podosphaera aphanis]|nr:putative alpha-1,6-mannosyltransferase [Podosphaera aphanis]